MTIQQILKRLSWWARNCDDDCPAAEAMEQAAKRLEKCENCDRCNCNMNKEEANE